MNFLARDRGFACVFFKSLNCDKLTNGSGLTLVPAGEEVEDGSQSLSAYAVPKQGGKVSTDCTEADHSDSAELAA